MPQAGRLDIKDRCKLALVELQRRMHIYLRRIVSAGELAVAVACGRIWNAAAVGRTAAPYNRPSMRKAAEKFG